MKGKRAKEASETEKGLSSIIFILEERKVKYGLFYSKKQKRVLLRESGVRGCQKVGRGVSEHEKSRKHYVARNVLKVRQGRRLA